MLRAEDVLNAKFAQTQFAEGYDEREVDGLLDAVVTALRHHENGSVAGEVITSAAVRSATFTPTRMRRGYAVADVDSMLEQAADALSAHEGAPSATAPPPSGPSASAGSAPAAADERPAEGLGARLLRLLRGEPRR